MSSRQRTLIKEALSRACDAISCFKLAQRRARTRAGREDIGCSIREMRSLAEKLRIMRRDGQRHSPLAVAALIGEMAEVIVKFMATYPPET